MLSIEVYGVKLIEPIEFKKLKLIIFSVANYGKAEAPKLDMEFWNNFFKLNDPKEFEGVNFAVFVCGSSKRVPYYQGFAKMVVKKMLKLGAT